MTKNKILVLVGILFVVGYFIFSNYQNKKENAGKNENKATTSTEKQKDFKENIDKGAISEKEEKALDEDKNTVGTREIEVIAKQWEFQPSVIELKKGDKVKLKIRSLDVPHGFAMPVGYKIDKKINPGETVEVEFVADKVGKFPYFCSIGCGKGHFEMAGEIIVSE
jgi:cytochrome c oxidase subunit 2